MINDTVVEFEFSGAKVASTNMWAPGTPTATTTTAEADGVAATAAGEADTVRIAAVARRFPRKVRQCSHNASLYFRRW